MESVFIITAVAGFVEFLRRVEMRDAFGASSIVAAAVIGGLAGYFGIEVASVADGIVAGLSASGLVTVVSRIGK